MNSQEPEKIEYTDLELQAQEVLDKVREMQAMLEMATRGASDPRGGKPRTVVALEILRLAIQDEFEADEFEASVSRGSQDSRGGKPRT